MPMEIILKILTLGIYGLFSKRKSLDQSVQKKKYRKDGTLKKEVVRDTNYDEGEALTDLPTTKNE